MTTKKSAKKDTQSEACPSCGHDADRCECCDECGKAQGGCVCHLQRSATKAPTTNETELKIEKAIFDTYGKLKTAVSPTSRERFAGEIAGLRLALKIVKESHDHR